MATAPERRGPASGQVPEKRNLVGRSPRRDHCNTGEHLRVGDSPKAQGHKLADHRNQQEPEEASTNPEKQVQKTRNTQGERMLGNLPLG